MTPPAPRTRPGLLRWLSGAALALTLVLPLGRCSGNFTLPREAPIDTTGGADTVAAAGAGMVPRATSTLGGGTAAAASVPTDPSTEPAPRNYTGELGLDWRGGSALEALATLALCLWPIPLLLLELALPHRAAALRVAALLLAAATSLYLLAFLLALGLHPASGYLVAQVALLGYLVGMAEDVRRERAVHVVAAARP